MGYGNRGETNGLDSYTGRFFHLGAYPIDLIQMNRLRFCCILYHSLKSYAAHSRNFFFPTGNQLKSTAHCETGPRIPDILVKVN